MLNNLSQRVSLIFLMCSSLSLLSGCDSLNDLPVGKGHASKTLCSLVFNSGLDEALATNIFIAPSLPPLPLIWRIHTDYDAQTVTVGDRIFGSDIGAATSIYRDGIGCTLLVNKSMAEVDAQPFIPLEPPVLPSDQYWPLGSAGLFGQEIPGLDVDALNVAVANAFIETEEVPRNTTSLVVIYDGKLVAEQYAFGATAQTPMMGWSMTKSISGTLIGILQDEGLINMDEPAPIPGWAGTEKELVTTRHILHMASGLEFNESAGGLSDLTRMFYLRSDQAAYAAAKPLLHVPGENFNYSTGQANMLAKIVQDAVGGTLQDAYDFYQTKLFHKIHITSAFIEFDSSGQFVGGASGFMTPRDWARLGQLYLQRGQWNGEQVVSSEWIDYVTQPSPAENLYGGQIWLNTNGASWQSLPRDTYNFAGFQGQQVIVVPSKNLVVVRTGVSRSNLSSMHEEYMGGIIAALPE